MENIVNTLFLSYLTGYNIKDIIRGIKANDIANFIESYLNDKYEQGVRISEHQIGNIRKNAEEKYEEMRFRGIEFVQIGSSLYPDSISRISSPPPMLYVRGRLKKGPHVAIVGTREVSRYASQSINKLVRIFSELGYGVVSGLAYGIDKAAHEAALRGGVYTLGVLPNSLDHIYPKDHLRLANEILENGGGLVSELPIGINLGKKGFVQRNRLQSAISSVVVPVEMGTNSGTMHTVQFAIQQKKSLLVIQPTDDQLMLPQYEGISFLAKSSYENLVILKADFEAKDIPGHTQNLSGINPLSSFEELSEEELSRRKQKLLQDIQDKIRVQCQLSLEDLEGKISNIENYSSPHMREFYTAMFKILKDKVQVIAFDYLFQHTLVSNKELEKLIKKELKKVEPLFLPFRKNKKKRKELNGQ